MDEPRRCPCCGSALDPVDRVHWNLNTRVVETPIGRRQLSPNESRLFNLIWSKRPARQTGLRMVDALYAHDPDGGPLGAMRTLHVVLSGLRGKLRPIGLNIETEGRKENYYATVFSNLTVEDRRRRSA
jgi:hypothetical protein